MVYVLNSDNCCYLLSSFVLLDYISMTSFAFVYSSLLITVFSKDKILIKKTLRESKGYGAKKFIKEFLDKNWNRRGLDYLLKKLRETGTVEQSQRTTGSGRRRSSRTMQNIDAVEDLRWETPNFISPDLWPPNSPDLNPVDYAIWAVMQRHKHQTKIHTIDELNQRLIEVWCGLEQSTVDMAVHQWRRRLRACVRAKGGHFEHNLWTYWSCWFCQQFITLCCVLFKCCTAE